MSDPNPSASKQASASAGVESTVKPEDLERTATPSRVADRIPRVFGRYRILDCLGRGGMGAVFRAHDTELDRQIALKIPFLSDNGKDTRERFYREARAAATLQHANICPVFDVGEFNGIPYLTMAFIEGRSLSQARSAGQQFTPQQIAVLMRKVALAMHEAHSKGVIHRDLKPANILLRPNGEPTVMDFGLARRLDEKKNDGLTKQGEIIGTVDYMSPEQVEGKLDTIGPATDVYALGVILYELLTGRRPFEGTTVSILTNIMLKAPTRPSELRSDVPAKLEEICQKALAKNPADRFPNMAQFANALADYLRGNVATSASAAMKPAETPAALPASPSTKNFKGRDTIIEAADFQPATSAKSAALSGKLPRSGKRKKKVEGRSRLPYIIGGAAAALLVLVVAIVAGIILSSNDKKDVAQAPPPAGTFQPPPPPGPPKPATPTQPTNTAAADKPKAPPKPRTPGFALRSPQEAVKLAVGQPQRVTLKVERQDYKGPISVNWTAPKGVRITPNGSVTLNPDKSDAVLTFHVLSELPPEPLRMNITGTPTQDKDRPKVTSSLEVVVTPGPCIRVVEIGDKPKGKIESMAFAPDASIVLIGSGESKAAAPPSNPGGAPAPPGGALAPPGGAAAPPGGPAPSDDEKHAIHVWNPDRGEALNILVGHRDKVKELFVSADGKTGLSVSADDTIATWDLAAGRRKLHSPKQTLRVLTAAMSPDAKRGVLVYAGAALRLNMDTLQPLGPPVLTPALMGSKAEDAVRAIAIASDKKSYVLTGVDGKVILLDMATAEKAKPRPLSGHSEIVFCAAFSPTSNVVATAGGGILQVGKLTPGKDNAVRLWDVAGAKIEWKADGHAASVYCLAFSPDGRFLASGSADGEIRVWSVADGKPVATFAGHTGKVLGLAFAPGKRLWSGGADHTLRAWRLP